MPIRAGGLNAACQPVAPSDGVDLECGVRNWESGTLVCSYFTSHIPNSAFRIPRSKFPIPTKSSRVDSNHRSTACKAGAFAARPRDVFDYSEFRIPHSEFPIPNSKSTPPRNRTSSNCFEDSHASITPARQKLFHFSKSGRGIRTLTTCFKGKSPVLGIPERLIPDLNRCLCRDRAVSIPGWTNEP